MTLCNRGYWLAAVALVCGLIPATGHPAELVLTDGRVIEGRLAELSSLGDAQMLTDAGALKLIAFADDQLRRTFIPRSPQRLREVRLDEAGAAPVEQFHLKQRSTDKGRAVAAVGPILRVTPFDKYGRRALRMNTRRGPVDVVQGITTLTPEWTQVEGITHVWDMRIATSSVPSAALEKILRKQTRSDDLDHYKKIARFYLQAERFREARETLQAAVDAFPDRDGLKKDLEPSIRSIRQLGTRRLLDELRMRREAGQHRLVYSGLKTFPSEGIAGEILQEVREMLDEYGELHTRGKAVFQQIEGQLAEVADPTTRDNLRPACKEIRAELSINTLPRMAAFRQNVDDPDLRPEQKLALALSGWLIGSDRATPNLPIALSLSHVRRLVREYLNETTRPNRELIFTKLGSEEAATPTMTAALLAHMRPPAELPEPIAGDKPGYYQIEVDALPGHPPVTYLVQTPPEYDPLRLYPTVLTLHGAGTTPENQIDWWAGAWNDRDRRAGQAARHGYIVIAPAWAADRQEHYRYSAREHAAVLAVLRDACRRLAIDTDRVFLSGHSMGGDAAWDLALAHP
ncbi:MAG: peptidase, partial [Pirellulales bacterium]